MAAELRPVDGSFNYAEKSEDGLDSCGRNIKVMSD